MTGCGAGDSTPEGTEPMVTPGTSAAPTANPGNGPDLTALETETVAALAAFLKADASTITVQSVEEVEWPSTALGCPAPDMMYATMIVPGAKLMVDVAGKTYEVHTDTEGTALICENGVPTFLDESPDAGGGTPPGLTPMPTTSARRSGRAAEVLALHAANFNIDATELQVIVDEEVTWPSSAKGCPEKGGRYMTVLTPGFRVVLQHGKESYAYHAGRDEQFFLCNNPEKPANL